MHIEHSEALASATVQNQQDGPPSCAKSRPSLRLGRDFIPLAYASRSDWLLADHAVLQEFRSGRCLLTSRPLDSAGEDRVFRRSTVDLDVVNHQSLAQLLAHQEAACSLLRCVSFTFPNIASKPGWAEGLLPSLRAGGATSMFSSLTSDVAIVTPLLRLKQFRLVVNPALKQNRRQFDVGFDPAVIELQFTEQARGSGRRSATRPAAVFLKLHSTEQDQFLHNRTTRSCCLQSSRAHARAVHLRVLRPRQPCRR